MERHNRELEETQHWEITLRKHPEKKKCPRCFRRRCNGIVLKASAYLVWDLRDVEQRFHRGGSISVCKMERRNWPFYLFPEQLQYLRKPSQRVRFYTVHCSGEEKRITSARQKYYGDAEITSLSGWLIRAVKLSPPEITFSTLNERATLSVI